MMPIEGDGTYLPTMNEVNTHWLAVNLELGGTPVTDMKLRGGYAILDFQTHRTLLQTAFDTIENESNNRELAAGTRDLLKVALRPRLSQFRNGVAVYLGGTPYEGALPTLPPLTAAEDTYLPPFDDMANLWGKMNTDTTTPDWTAPLLLAGGYPRATFLTDLAGLRAAYVAVTTADKNWQLSLRQRDALLKLIYERLLQYRSAVLLKFDEGHPLVTSLPAVTPPPGSTPAAVVLSGTWNAGTSQADLSWTPSAAATLQNYSLRTSPGPVYDTTQETTVASIPANQTTFSTTSGLTLPGATALFKVYVVLTTGNEKGSNTLELTRPE